MILDHYQLVWLAKNLEPGQKYSHQLPMNISLTELKFELDLLNQRLDSNSKVYTINGLNYFKIVDENRKQTGWIFYIYKEKEENNVDMEQRAGRSERQV